MTFDVIAIQEPLAGRSGVVLGIVGRPKAESAYSPERAGEFSAWGHSWDLPTDGWWGPYLRATSVNLADLALIGNATALLRSATKNADGTLRTDVLAPQGG